METGIVWELLTPAGTLVFDPFGMESSLGLSRIDGMGGAELRSAVANLPQLTAPSSLARSAEPVTPSSRALFAPSMTSRPAGSCLTKSWLTRTPYGWPMAR